MCRMGPRVVVEQAHAVWQHSSPFVLNGLLKPCQGVRICSGINCCARRHEVDQENAFSDFFHWDLSFEFFGSGGMHMVPLQWLLLGFRSVVKNPMFHLQSQWSSETHLLPVRSAWETSAQNPSVPFCDSPLTFWASSMRTTFCTLSFLSKLHELWS